MHSENHTVCTQYTCLTNTLLNTQITNFILKITRVVQTLDFQVTSASTQFLYFLDTTQVTRPGASE